MGYEKNTTAAKIIFCLAGRVVKNETLVQYKPRTTYAEHEFGFQNLEVIKGLLKTNNRI